MYLWRPCHLRLFSRLRTTPEVCLFIGWNFFFSWNVLLVWVPGHNSVPGNVTVFIYDSDGMLLHILWVRSTNSFSYLDIVLSSVITFYLFCRSDGWLLHARILCCGGYAFFQVHKNLKCIYPINLWLCWGCTLGRSWFTVSVLDVVHLEGKCKGKKVRMMSWMLIGLCWVTGILIGFLTYEYSYSHKSNTSYLLSIFMYFVFTNGFFC